MLSLKRVWRFVWLLAMKKLEALALTGIERIMKYNQIKLRINNKGNRVESKEM